MSSASGHENSPPPFVAVGGLGGSGTRLVAALLAEFGVFLGHDLNKALDNLAFTLLFKRPELPTLSGDELDRDLQLFATGMTRSRALTADEQTHLHARASEQRAGHPEGWLQTHADTLINVAAPPLASTQLWGWKEPNTHMLLPALIRNFPQMRYIHVVRHGLDMAFSRNQSQLQYWGDGVLGSPGEPGPARALSYWCAVQRRALRLGETMGTRFLWLDYDRVCHEPEQGLDRLSEFLELPCPNREAMLALIDPPASIGRFRKFDCSMFASDDVAAVAEFGFEVN
jgi:hypothetical protein